MAPKEQRRAAAPHPAQPPHPPADSPHPLPAAETPRPRQPPHPAQPPHSVVSRSLRTPQPRTPGQRLSAAAAVRGAGGNCLQDKYGSGRWVPSPSLPPRACRVCPGLKNQFLLYAMDSYWHSRCLKCSCCQAQLGDIGTSCYTKSGMILCRNDYIRLFGNSGACSACEQKKIPASELVMRAQGNVYHLKCFTCSTCRNRLVPGDRFHYINGSLFCEHDRPTALINGHLNSLQSNPLLPDQKVC
ncbi:PREDICTED: LOW QUALITY PROTEIN: LIM domain transcription factor LMO4 [Chaetura pelagica]|uniref:LOW QUALITY PROTEIN: LIM domain transcription factor LMO4 n=1 Tax=Chaetura pelagica TaxID=8897 RepID=UPI000523E79E|nr:PREDICTED: LOW QUALITY PROTEIN: LIM domain transcription factor LMO4 [Chaetura pelagica]